MLGLVPSREANTLVENAKPRMYYGNQEGVCDLVLKLEDAVYGGKTFDVGFKKNKDGTYDIVMDDWGRAISGQTLARFGSLLLSSSRNSPALIWRSRK